MSIPWATAPRRHLVDEIAELLAERDAGGIALLGVDGVGKTTLAGQIAERLGQRSGVWVIGTATQLPEFAAAFSCPAGAAMAPAKTCEVW